MVSLQQRTPSTDTLPMACASVCALPIQIASHCEGVEVILVLEIASNSLLELLRSHARQAALPLSAPRPSRSRSDGPDANTAESTLTQSVKHISKAQLVHIMIQVASGMEYMAAHYIVHLDLAARNVLVTYGTTTEPTELQCKIADFGLSKSLIDSDVVAVGKQMVPWKWASLETLRDGSATIASDMWSFGILMSEIINLGTKPYPGTANANLLEVLTHGFRIPREHVKGASPMLYGIMLSTWLEDPRERPKFRDMTKLLGAVDDMVDDAVTIDSQAALVFKQRTEDLQGWKPEDKKSQLQEKNQSQWYVPYSPSSMFTGRLQELDALEQRLIRRQQTFEVQIMERKQAAKLGLRVTHASKMVDEEPYRVVISACGGAGKTQLMLRYAWENKASYPGGVYWVESDTEERLRRSFIGIATQLGAESGIKDHSDHVSCAWAVVEALGKIKNTWLLCIDSVDSEFEFNLLQQVYIPASLVGGHIVVTTRRNETESFENLGARTSIRLEMLGSNDAMVLLYKCARGLTDASNASLLESIAALPRDEREVNTYLRLYVMFSWHY